ncbi:hypothetical protein VTO73DRAFT_12071 [Trametes versicolor]
MDAPTALFLPSPPPLDNTFGAFLLGTFLGLVLYGVTIHQAYRYIRLYHNDGILVKVFVVCIFVVETLQISTCMHTCYFYLVTNYFDPQALARGVWSIQVNIPFSLLVNHFSTVSSPWEGPICHLRTRGIPLAKVCTLYAFSNCSSTTRASFFARRVYLGRSIKWSSRLRLVSHSDEFITHINVDTIQGLLLCGSARHERLFRLSLISLRIPSPATTVQGIKIHTFQRFQHYTWMDSVAFAAAVASDALTTGVLIYVLKASRTGFKKTDHIIDRLMLYAVNTGFLTGVFDLLALIFAVVYPDNLVYFAFSIVATKVYANSLLAVLNTRHSGIEGRDPGSTIGIHAVPTHNETRVTVAGMWNAQQMAKNDSETAIELKTSDTSSV